jgi:hypothetical protein
MEGDPLVPVLAGLVVDLPWWLDTCGDDEIDPDSAVKMMEVPPGCCRTCRPSSVSGFSG